MFHYSKQFVIIRQKKAEISFSSLLPELRFFIMSSCYSAANTGSNALFGFRLNRYQGGLAQLVLFKGPKQEKIDCPLFKAG